MKKRLQKLIRDLNAEADAKWMDEKHIELWEYEETEDGYRLVIAIDKWDSIPFAYDMDATEGWCVTPLFDEEDESVKKATEVAEQLGQMLYAFLFSSIRFDVESLDNNMWQLTDNAYNIVITWEQGKFNETQTTTLQDEQDLISKYGADLADKLAKVMKEIADYLRADHLEKIFDLDDRQLLGFILSQMRKENNLSQQDLADATSISKSTINNIENGKFSPRMDIVLKLINKMGFCIEFQRIKDVEKANTPDTPPIILN